MREEAKRDSEFVLPVDIFKTKIVDFEYLLEELHLGSVF